MSNLGNFKSFNQQGKKSLSVQLTDPDRILVIKEEKIVEKSEVPLGRPNTTQGMANIPVAASQLTQ